MKIYFRKFDPRNCYIINYCIDEKKEKYIPGSIETKKLHIKLENFLTEKFKSIIIDQHVTKHSAYFDFNFNNKADEAHFLLMSNDGIEI